MPDARYLIPLKYAERITFNPNQCGGRPCIRGMRVRVKDVLEMVSVGMPWEQITENWFGRVSHEAITEAVALANAA